MKYIKYTFRIYVTYLFIFGVGLSVIYMLRSPNLNQANYFNQGVFIEVLLISILASFFMTASKIKVDKIVNKELGL